MLCALPDSQRRQAVLSFSKTGNNNLSEAFKDNVVLDYAGLRANELANAARRRLRDLIRLYASNMDDGHTRVKMDEVDRHIDDTWFSWIGSVQNDSAFYYRVQSPVILIEFGSPAAGQSGKVWGRSQDANPTAYSLCSANA
jgi:Protein of unknown function (DUF3500)